MRDALHTLEQMLEGCGYLADVAELQAEFGQGLTTARPLEYGQALLERFYYRVVFAEVAAGRAVAGLAEATRHGQGVAEAEIELPAGPLSLNVLAGQGADTFAAFAQVLLAWVDAFGPDVLRDSDVLTAVAASGGRLP